jgi:hypothetical protein
MIDVKRQFEKHGWLWPLVAFLCTVGSLYAYRDHSGTSPLASVLDLAFAIVGGIAFVGLLLSWISDLMNSN